MLSALKYMAWTTLGRVVFIGILSFLARNGTCYADDFLERWLSCGNLADCTVANDPCGEPIAVNREYLEPYRQWARTTRFHCVDKAGLYGITKSRYLEWKRDVSKHLECRQLACSLQPPGAMTDEEKHKEMLELLGKQSADNHSRDTDAEPESAIEDSK